MPANYRVTRWRRHKYSEELSKKGSANVGITTVPGTVCSGKHLLFHPRQRKRAATLEKTKPSNHTPNNFSHATGLSIFQGRRPLSAPRAPQRALLPRLTKPPAPERCWTPRTCFFLLPKCTSTLSKHPRFSDAQGLCAQPAPPNPAEPKPKTQTTSS